LEAASKALLPAFKRIQKALTGLDPNKLPAGSLSDFLYELRDLPKLLANLTAPFGDLIPEKIKELEEHFVKTLTVGEASGIQGQRARVQITESAIPVVEDWPKLYAFIKRTNSFELLNRAPNRGSIQERWDAKKQVPGVGKFIAKKVSCTKLRGK
jgi:hypothetical protein